MDTVWESSSVGLHTRDQQKLSGKKIIAEMVNSVQNLTLKKICFYSNLKQCIILASKQ